MAKKEIVKYYSLDNILSHNADYNIIYGERSNGKTTSVLKYALIDFCESGYKNQLGIIRRFDEDFKGKNAKQMTENLVQNAWISQYTKCEYNSIYYYSQKWYLCFYDDEGKKIRQTQEPFAFGFALTAEEHYKSSSYPNIKTILFDEFITRKYYLPDEFITFQNMLSTIIRLRGDVKIFMCGNSINRYNPYFHEMGLTGVKKQKQGSIDVYRYGDSELVVAVEYSDMPSKKKESNKYFAFNNPKLQMITNGGWELDIYPHLPKKYTPNQVGYIFYIIFDGEIFQGNVICADEGTFIYIHRKTTPIKEDNDRLVYQQTTDYRYNYRTNIFRPYGKADLAIKTLIDRKKVFYQDNEVGDTIHNYFKWCAMA